VSEASLGVQREVEQMERQFPEMNATAEHAGRLASLLMLSYEPMFAWSLDGAIEFWNAGAERLYGFASSEAVGTVSYTLLQDVPFSKYASTRSPRSLWHTKRCPRCIRAGGMTPLSARCKIATVKRIVWRAKSGLDGFPPRRGGLCKASSGAAILADVLILHDVARQRIDRDWAARALHPFRFPRNTA
jgi:PAS domain-containing protein